MNLFLLLWFGPGAAVLLGIGCYAEAKKIVRWRRLYPRVTYNPFTGEVWFNDEKP